MTWLEIRLDGAVHLRVPYKREEAKTIADFLVDEFIPRVVRRLHKRVTIVQRRDDGFARIVIGA